ncbi:PREDICTED: uncharacterized protein LOC104595213 isoform X2 [Nelumbo nucifera]|uniref:Uncharacterized protein LOC104595213 isoform X2 n=1 Tax=Nelumbo nucifera TaxID=4432 RepID=A0A1U7ZQE7_NELNU|nr:PREDICTED: uncharacterized protein LOC104595213 isoform X2 [Nelumbo nucifera]
MRTAGACPEECREAVPSLMFAAARFADLPELRDLRQIFTEKYGSSLEAFVNQEFVEKLAPKPLTMDKKLQLMRKIAQEFSIKWDSTAFEQNMSNQKMPNAPSSAQDQLKKHRSFNDGNDNGHNVRDGREDTVPKRDNQNVFSRGRQEITKDGYKSHNDREDTVPKRDNPDHLLHERKELTGDEYKLHKGRGDAIQKKEDRDLSSHGRQESNINGYKSFNGREDNIPKRNNQDGLSRGRWEVIKDAYEPRKGMDHTVAEREKQDLLSDGRREFTDDGYKRHNTIGDTVMKRDKQELLSDGRREFTDDGYKRYNARGDRQEFTDDGYKRHNTRGDRREFTDNGYKRLNTRGDGQEFTDDGYKRHNTRGDIADDGYKRHNTRGDTLMKREQDILSCPRQELIDDEYKHYNHREVPRRPEVAPTHTAREQVKAVGKDKPIPGSSHNDLQNHSNSIENVPKEEAKSMKPFSNNIVPPPYIKPKDGKYGTKPEAHLTGSDFDGSSLGPAFHNRDFGNNQRPQMAKNKSDHVDYERQMAGPERMNGQGDEKNHYQQSDSADDGKPKPRSVRRRHLKPPSGCENDGNFEFDEGVKRSSSGRRRDHARRRHHALFDDDQDQKDEEEKMMDRLLIHYSKKQPAYEQCVHNRLRRESKDPTAHQARADVSEKQPPCEQYVQDRPRKEFKPPAHQVHADVSERRRHRNRDGDHLSSEARHPLARTLSLPSEPQTPTEVSRRPVRAASFQPDRASSAAHVHPKLPDYDDLADRIAALRGR